MTRQQADTVRANQRSAITFTAVQDALFQFCTGLGLLTETGRNNNERARLFLLGHEFHIVRTELRGYYEDGQIGVGQFLDIMEGFDPLHFFFLGVNNAQGATVTATNQVAYDRAAGLMYVVGATDNDDALRIQ